MEIMRVCSAVEEADQLAEDTVDLRQISCERQLAEFEHGANCDWTSENHTELLNGNRGAAAGFPELGESRPERARLEDVIHRLVRTKRSYGLHCGAAAVGRKLR